MSVRRISALALVVLTLAVLQGCRGCTAANPDSPRVVILYPEPHPVLNEIIVAFKSRTSELVDGIEFVERHASGQKSQYPALVRAALHEPGLALVVPVTTPMSIEVMRQARAEVPVVFLGVTDPVGAGLVETLDAPVRSSGVSDNPPMDAVVDLVKQLVPEVKAIGIPYDPRDQPGVLTARLAESACRQRGIVARLRPVASETELRSAVRGLAQETDALLIGMDNLMMKNAGLIASTIAPFGRPLFAADDKSVEMGALAGVGVNYKDVGYLGAEIAAQVLDGESVGLIPVRQLSSGRSHFNMRVAETFGIQVPN